MDENGAPAATDPETGEPVTGGETAAPGTGETMDSGDWPLDPETGEPLPPELVDPDAGATEAPDMADPGAAAPETPETQPSGGGDPAARRFRHRRRRDRSGPGRGLRHRELTGGRRMRDE